MAAVCASFAILTHLWVGRVEEALFALVPVGHASIMAMCAWIAAILVASLAVAATRRHARVAWIALALGFVGAALPWWGTP